MGNAERCCKVLEILKESETICLRVVALSFSFESGCRKRGSAKGFRSLFFGFLVAFWSLSDAFVAFFTTFFARLLLPDSFAAG